MRGRKGLTKTECFIALELTMCSRKQRSMLPWTAMEGGEGGGERKGGVTGGYLLLATKLVIILIVERFYLFY